MGDKTGISWTEATWNPIVGCSVHSPGCARCYAMRVAHRLALMHGRPDPASKYAGLTVETKAGPVWNGVVRDFAPALDQPIRWMRPRWIFVNSMSDLFHEALPDAIIARVIAVMLIAHHHRYQVLTKRDERMRDFLSSARTLDLVDSAIDELAPEGHTPPEDAKWPASHIWWGVSVEDRPRVARIDTLRKTEAAHRFVSFEPLLESLGEIDLSGIEWAILGGESGKDARDCPVHGIADLIRQCRRQRVRCYVKQLGARPVWPFGRTLDLASPKADDPAEWPAELRVRQMPIFLRGAA